MLEEFHVPVGLGHRVVHRMHALVSTHRKVAAGLKPISTVRILAASSKSTDAMTTDRQFLAPPQTPWPSSQLPIRSST